MDLSVSHSLCFSLLLIVCLPFCQMTPVSSHVPSSVANLESLKEIIMEIENALYKLKEYTRDVQAANSRKESSVAGGSSDIKADLEAEELQLEASKQQQQAAYKPRPAQQQQQSSSQLSELDSTDDLSLREALEYLVGLAKQKKLERRDHDIPFPISSSERADREAGK